MPENIEKQEVIEAGRQALYGVCQSEKNFRMSIPVQDTDTDQVIARAFDYAEKLKCILDRIRQLSDVGDLLDGADHLNEHTHKENEKALIAALDKIHLLASEKITVDES